MSIGGMRASDGLGEALATPTDRMERLERELDSQAQARSIGKSRHGQTPEMRGRSGSTSRDRGAGSQPITIQSKPAKGVTVGFGAGSFTRSPKVNPPGQAATKSTPPASPKRADGEAKKKGGPPKDIVKKPKLSKAERRALQEKQRADKAAKEGGAPKKPKQVSSKIQADDQSKSKLRSKKLRKAGVPERKSNQKQVELFSHLRQYDTSVSLTDKIPFGAKSNIHPSIIQLGLRYSEGHVNGSTARCIAMLHAFKEVITDFVTPPGKDMSRVFATMGLSPCITFLAESRHNADSMGNAIKYLKHEITKIEEDVSEDETKARLIEAIDKFIQERIVLAQRVISESIRTKIQDDDVILVHGCSKLMETILKDAFEEGKRFRVIMVDSRPKANGVKGLVDLVALGIKVTYVLINSISYVMKEVTKVFLTAHALLANGYVMSRIGSSVISMMARAYNVPVLVACETYKFSERVQTDSFVYNELGDPAELATTGCKRLDGWEEHDSLKLLNLVYDVTPPEFVDMVVTDIGMVPCTSVPVVLRVKGQIFQ
jgi:translation initiation factor eIF-2B subunit delta